MLSALVVLVAFAVPSQQATLSQDPFVTLERRMAQKPGYWGLHREGQGTSLLDDADNLKQADERMSDVIKQMSYSLTHQLEDNDRDLGESDSWPSPPHPHDPKGFTSEFKDADQDHNGHLSYHEVTRAFRKKMPGFKAFDVNKDGSISRDEFQHFDTNRDHSVSHREYSSMSSGKGQVGYTNTINATIKTRERQTEVQLLGETHIPDWDVTVDVTNTSANASHGVNIVASTSGKAPLQTNSSSNSSNLTVHGEELPEVTKQSGPPPLFGLNTQRDSIHTGARAKRGPQSPPDKPPSQNGFDDTEENVNRFLNENAQEEASRQQMARAAMENVQREMTRFQDQQHD